MRTGVIARKLGMTQMFDENGMQTAVSVLKVSPCTVLAQRKQQEDGYTAVQLGSEDLSASKLSKPLRGFFEKKSLAPKRLIKEFRVDEKNLVEVGQNITVDHFKEKQEIDVTGSSQGKGFAGAMKRHGFGGMPASHGVSISHRAHGSTGQCQDPGKTFKNKKMAGQMGSKRVTILNLEVYGVNKEDNLIYVKGAVPGPKNGVVYVRDAIKKMS